MTARVDVSMCGVCGRRTVGDEDPEHLCRGSFVGEVDVFGASSYHTHAGRFGGLSVKAVRSIGDNELRIAVELLTENGEPIAAFTVTASERDALVALLTDADAPHWRSYRD